MNNRRVPFQLLFYFLTLMFLMIVVGCVSSDNTPPPAKTHTVTFDSQGATVAASPASITVTSPATTVGALPTEPTNIGFNFAGWHTGTYGTGTEFMVSTPVTADITVYALWSTSPVYTITYNSDGGTDVGVQHFTDLETPVHTLPVAPTKTGYIFGGWFTAVDGGGTQFNENTVRTGNITVYAKWNSYSYTVTFDSQGATVAASPTSIIVASPATTVVTLPAQPIKTGYTFAGWWTATNGSGTAFTASTVVTGNITVYAYWSANPVYTVTYDSQEGTAVGAQQVVSGGTVGTLPAPPTKTGYIFGGWFTDVDGSGTQFTASTPVTANITVYAKWNSYSYTVTFDSQGATVPASPTSIIVASPATTVVTLPAAPTKTGYTFAGWWTGPSGAGTAFTASTTVTGNITVYAKWTAVTGSYTATATYTWNSGTSTLVITWTGSNFICNGPPSSGSETETGVTITTTTMTWPNSNEGLGMTWTRSSGTASDPSGTWTTTDNEGNTYTAVVTATNSTSGSMSISGTLSACGSRDYNPGVETVYQPGDTGYTYEIDMWYNDNPKSASAVSVSGHGISGTQALTYNTTGNEWDYWISGDTVPTGLPWTYTFTIDSTTKNVTVTCFQTNVPTITAPTSGGTVSTTTPIFIWTGISASDAVYKVYVQDNSGNTIWQKKTTSNSIGYDGPAFSTATTYYLNVDTYSYSTCKDGTSHVYVLFTYVP